MPTTQYTFAQLELLATFARGSQTIYESDAPQWAAVQELGELGLVQIGGPVPETSQPRREVWLAPPGEALLELMLDRGAKQVAGSYVEFVPRAVIR